MRPTRRADLIGGPPFQRRGNYRLKASVLKVVKRLRSGKVRPPPPPARQPSARTSAGKPAGGPKVPRPPAADVTGQTVFDDRPLRFRNLTLIEADLTTLVDAGTIEGAFKIRVARRTGARRAAGALVERRYTGRGYTLPASKKNPLLSTFVAYDDCQIVGTVGVRLDSSEGLGADELYKDEIDALRRKGFRVCEFTRLAVDRTAASKPVLAGLFHTAYLYAAVINRCTHALIEVNPRHVAFYGKALGFSPIGPERLNKRVNAPAVLLCAPFTFAVEGLAKAAAERAVPGPARSFFYYWFSPDDERGVLGRLRDLVAQSRKR